MKPKDLNQELELLIYEIGEAAKKRQDVTEKALRMIEILDDLDVHSCGKCGKACECLYAS